MRKAFREIKRAFPGAEITTTGSNHYRVALPNGGVVIISNSPSDQNFMRYALADARRQSKIQPRSKGDD